MNLKRGMLHQGLRFPAFLQNRPQDGGVDIGEGHDPATDESEGEKVGGMNPFKYC